MSNTATGRNFLTCTAAAAATAAAPIAKPGCEPQPQTFLLVHGAWHSSFCWTQVSAWLAAAGHRVVAIDLPGQRSGVTLRGREWRSRVDVRAQPDALNRLGVMKQQPGRARLGLQGLDSA